MLNKLFDSMLYVKIYKNKIVVNNLSNNLPPQMFTPDISFTTTRLLIGTFAPAAQCLKRAVSSSTPNSWFKAKPVLLIQPMEMNDGGLSEVEDRILRECAIGAGARKIIVWIGAELSNDKAIEKINSSR
jgi:hypothetical protein